MIATQFENKIKVFQSDSRGEYIYHRFRAFLADKGTQAQISYIATPQQNGIAERKHKNVIKTARSLIYLSYTSEFLQRICFDCYLSDK